MRRLRRALPREVRHTIDAQTQCKVLPHLGREGRRPRAGAGGRCRRVHARYVRGDWPCRLFSQGHRPADRGAGRQPVGRRHSRALCQIPSSRHPAVSACRRTTAPGDEGRPAAVEGLGVFRGRQRRRALRPPHASCNPRLPGRQRARPQPGCGSGVGRSPAARQATRRFAGAGGGQA